MLLSPTEKAARQLITTPLPMNAAIIQASGDPRSLDPAGKYMINPSDDAAQVNQTINRFLADPANGYNDNRGVTPQSPGPTILQSQ